MTTTTQPAQAGPPEGYRKCPCEGCPRWSRLCDAGGSCLACARIVAMGAENFAKGNERFAPDWTPPLSPPTPAPARERRAGQRYKDWVGYEYTLTRRSGSGMWFASCPAVSTEVPIGHEGESIWSKLTLLSDAPATSEPGRACAGCRAEVCICDVLTHHASRPAQEAAKAEPKCVRAGKPGHMKCEGPVLSRVLGHKDDGAVAALYCELAMRQWEIRAFHNTESETRPYTGPERLPRPRLAHSAMWADWAEDAS